eukprot:3709219-Rhodomonas_salina.1
MSSALSAHTKQSIVPYSSLHNLCQNWVSHRIHWKTGMLPGDAEHAACEVDHQRPGAQELEPVRVYPPPPRRVFVLAAVAVEVVGREGEGEGEGES